MGKENKHFHRGAKHARAKFRSEVNNHFNGKQQILWLAKRVTEEVDYQVSIQVAQQLKEIDAAKKLPDWRYEEY